MLVGICCGLGLISFVIVCLSLSDAGKDKGIVVDGCVVDEHRVPISGAVVKLLPPEVVTTTNDGGTFRIRFNELGEMWHARAFWLEVKKPGFKLATVDVRVDEPASLVIRLEAE